MLFIGFYSRVLRGSILDTMSEDYVRTARAKGLSERRVLVQHILRMSLLPIISLWGLDLAQVIGGGAILTESVYNLHGVGQLAATAIGNFDTVTLLSIVMLTALAVVVLSALVDILYAVLDPRIRLAMSDAAAATIDELKVSFAHRRGRRPRRRRRLVHRRPRRGRRDRRRVRLGQVGHRHDADGPDPRAQRARSRAAPTLDGKELLTASDAELRKIRGNDIAMIFQDPMSSLNPVYRVGWQIVEQIRTHDPEVSKAERWRRRSS